MSDERYAFGKTCMWHGPVMFARLAPEVDENGQEAFTCPVCGEPLIVTTSAPFWSEAKASEKAIPEYTAMLRWSEGRCFADFADMQNAYRQAMEGL